MDSELLGQLAATVISKKNNGVRPYVLFLGAGASVESGFPLLGDLARAVMGAKGGRRSVDREAFDHRWSALSPSERYATFWGAVKGGGPGAVAPSEGYFYLAHLIQAGFFDTVITTNADSLLEDSLRQYTRLLTHRLRVLVVHENLTGFEDRLRARTSNAATVIKVHGDAESFLFPFTQHETRELPPDVEQELRRLMAEDIIVVGNKMQDWDIQWCLRNEGGSIWHVGPSGPAREIMVAMGHRSCESNVLHFTFDSFFKQLADRLLPRSPIFNSWVDRFRDGSLENITYVFGDYGFQHQQLSIGRLNQFSCLRLAQVYGQDVTVRMQLRITESSAPSDWVGCWARGMSPNFVDGNLVYLRQNGSIEIYGPPNQILAAGQAFSIDGSYAIEAAYKGHQIRVRCGELLLETTDEMKPAVLNRQGYVYLMSNNCRAAVSSIHVLPTERYEENRYGGQRSLRG